MYEINFYLFSTQINTFVLLRISKINYVLYRYLIVDNPGKI